VSDFDVWCGEARPPGRAYLNYPNATSEFPQSGLCGINPQSRLGPHAPHGFRRILYESPCCQDPETSERNTKSDCTTVQSHHQSYCSHRPHGGYKKYIFLFRVTHLRSGPIVSRISPVFALSLFTSLFLSILFTSLPLCPKSQSIIVVLHSISHFKLTDRSHSH